MQFSSVAQLTLGDSVFIPREWLWVLLVTDLSSFFCPAPYSWGVLRGEGPSSVTASCWSQVPAVIPWVEEQNFSPDAFRYVCHRPALKCRCLALLPIGKPVPCCWASLPWPAHPCSHFCCVSEKELQVRGRFRMSPTYWRRIPSSRCRSFRSLTEKVLYT